MEFESTFCLKSKNIEKHGEVQVQKDHLKYCRTLHQKERDFSLLISNLYQVKYSFVACSGLNAIDVALRSFTFRYRNHDIFVFYSSELYQETKSLLESFYELGLFHSIQSFNIMDSIEKLFSQLNQCPSTAEILIFVESCSNPNGYVFDFTSFQRDKKDNMTLLVDNTWLTGFNFNPFKYGSDIVVESLSKYMSSGKAICGSISTNSDIFGGFYLTHSIKTSGIHIPISTCELMIQNFVNVETRMEQSWIKTSKLIESLQRVENVVDIIHPFLIHHSSHSIFNQLVKTTTFPSVFVILINVPQGKIHFDKMLKLWKITKLTSFGGQLSRIDENYEFVAFDKVKLRISIGFLSDENFNENFVCFVESLKQNVD